MGEDPKGKNCLQLPSVPITASHSCIFLQQPVESADFSDAPLNDLGLVYILFITTAVHTLPLTRTCTHLYTHTHKRTHIHLHTHTPTNPHCRLLGSIWQLRSDSAVTHTHTHTHVHTHTPTNPHCRLLGCIWQLRPDTAVIHTRTHTNIHTQTHVQHTHTRTYTNRPPLQAPW